MKHIPLVSVVIPTFNCAKYILSALDSVLAQTYRPIEVIVVDDGSTDGTTDIIRNYTDVRYYYQFNQGVSVARNVGIEAAHGEFIAFLDADDCWKNNKLKVQINFMLKYPEFGYTSTQVLDFLDINSPKSLLSKHKGSYDNQIIILPSTLVVRKNVFDKIGAFSPDYPASP